MGLSRSKIEGYMLPVKKGKFYEKEAVDKLLSDIAFDCDDTLMELQESRERVRELEKREESIAQALVIVKQVSDQIVEKAKNEAERIIMESTAKKLEIEEETARLEGLRDKYREELESQIRSMMNKIIAEVRAVEH